jgi:16S rRNA (cytidine1402-2'-O)-methyltransferase
MPGISDPGAVIVAAAVAEGVRVVPVPGPCAAVAALAAAGLPTDQFYFVGFLPPKSGRRQAALAQVGGLTQGLTQPRMDGHAMPRVCADNTLLPCLRAVAAGGSHAGDVRAAARARVYPG